MTLIIPEPGNDKWHLQVKRPAVIEVSQYSEMDDSDDPDTDVVLCLDSFTNSRLPPAGVVFTSPKCQPLHHCHALISPSFIWTAITLQLSVIIMSATLMESIF